MAVNGIPIYSEIDDLHQLTGSNLKAYDPLFHCFDMATANELKIEGLPPHRADFYTLALNFGTQHLDYTLNDHLFHHPSHFVVCVAPGQVVNWDKNGDWLGYCCFFKTEFLQAYPSMNFLEHFPFFNIAETNLLEVDKKVFTVLSAHFNQIMHEQSQQLPYANDIIRSIFLAVLWEVRRLYEASTHQKFVWSKGATLVSKFRFLVNQHFLDTTTVEGYARMLHVSADHLSDTVMRVTGTTAKGFIASRRLEEGKYLLQYSSSDIAEIAFHLQFAAPTHFTKFFRKETGITPAEYRLATK